MKVTVRESLGFSNKNMIFSFSIFKLRVSVTERSFNPAFAHKNGIL